MSRRLVLAVSLAAVVVVVVGVAVLRAQRGPVPVVVDGRVSGSVEVPAGTQLHVDFGRVGTSVGDQWQLTVAPDGAVLRDLGQDWELTPDCQGPGCEQLMVWRFDAVGAGTTSLRFQYCYRSRVPDCESEPSRGPAQPVVVAVTVTAVRAGAISLLVDGR